MADFTSSLYLGLTHDHAGLRPWRQMTMGAPAALRTMAGTGAVAADLAALAGCEAATLFPSTLHLFHDLFLLWPATTHALYVDAGAYEVSKWGAELACARGMATKRFRHHDAESLARAMDKDRTCGKTPVVVTDGFCPGCGAAAPLERYLACMPRGSGWLVVDDTQALGVLGRGPSSAAPFGAGGGGTMSWLGLKDARVLTAASLAKAFGAPVAFAGGTRKAMVRLEQRSETRVHCSPVAAPALHAAEAAVAFNEHSGERTRGALMRLLMRLKEKLAETAFAARGALFPSVALGECEGFPAEEVHAALSRMEIRTVLQRERVSGRPQVGVLVTAGHTVREIDRLASSLAGLADVRRQPKTGGVRARF